jgi:hypothetical protein
MPFLFIGEAGSNIKIGALLKSGTPRYTEDVRSPDWPPGMVTDNEQARRWLWRSMFCGMMYKNCIDVRQIKLTKDGSVLLKEMVCNRIATTTSSQAD